MKGFVFLFVYFCFALFVLFFYFFFVFFLESTATFDRRIFCPIEPDLTLELLYTTTVKYSVIT